MPDVRVRLDFVLTTEGEALPTIDTLNFIEAGCHAGINAKTLEIHDGAQTRITRRLPRRRTK